jgi:glycosyltransferase involved in cell wall biosynthesis
MHVAYVIDNLGSGGAQRQVVELAVRLHRDADVKVSLAVYRSVGFFLPRLEEAGIAVRELVKRGPLDPLFPMRLRRWVEEESPDLVHAFLPAPVLWSAVARSPGARPRWIAAERSTPGEGYGLGWKLAMRWAYRRFDAVTVNSHPAARVLVEQFGIRRERIEHLTNGIDLDEWDRRSAGEPPHALEPGRMNLALVGRLSPEKNHLLYLDALARLPAERRQQTCTWFIGAEDEPTLSGGIHDAIERRGLAGCVRVVPATRELPALLARVDALVLPSRFEGFPNVVLEAMASRIPVLASGVGEVPYMLEDGRTGWVVVPDDRDALADGLSRLIAMSEDQRVAMGAAARATVESRYDIDIVVRRHLEFYARVAGEPDAFERDAGAAGLG